MPVFNGENFLDDAISSVRAQTFDDLELLVQDNASTDRTSAIAQDHAAADPRVKYVRNETNLGAAPNYNLAWERGRGTYFKWLAHDDRIQPGYVAATVAALDAAPDAVLANTVVDYIDSQGKRLGLYATVLQYAGGPRPSERLAAMILRSHSVVDFFGMVRRRAMQGSLLHASFHGADRAFLAQMALRGRLLQLPEPLVQMREHPGRYTRQQKTAKARLSWHDARRSRERNLPTLTLYREYAKLVAAEPLDPAERAACRHVLRRWWFSNWNSIRVAVDLVAVPFPAVVSLAERVKFRVFGAAPGHFVR
ncbi:MAG: glycosyltransferase family A protein [Geminicoccaceae bacterium]